MEYYSGIKMNEVHATTQKKLTHVMQKKRKQTQKTTCMIQFIPNIQKRKRKISRDRKEITGAGGGNGIDCKQEKGTFLEMFKKLDSGDGCKAQ